MRSSELDLLIYLAEKGALKRCHKITTIALAKELKTSQQTASRWIIELQRQGYIERSNSGIKLTKKSRDLLKSIYTSLHKTFSKRCRPIDIEGELFDGFREARFYISLPEYTEQFENKLGFKPYPGTLNLKLKTVEDMSNKDLLKHGIIIKGFERDGRTYGKVECFPCIINDKVKGAVIFPERNHYGPNVIQIIAPVNLRKKLKIKPGDTVTISV
ncbi:MAG: CTP-dependent riboflavin kinase [Candidatus Diapherotrites archaeon]|nr:CTP-dependent riboflavin kinase [Candidatus Diapherotrites archaeon]